MNAALQTQTKALVSSSLTPVQAGLAQRKCACGGAAAGPHGGCATCVGQRLALQHRPLDQTGRDTSFDGAQDASRPPAPLADGAARASTAPAFGHDFGRVQAHYVAPKLAQSASGSPNEPEVHRMSAAARDPFAVTMMGGAQGGSTGKGKTCPRCEDEESQQFMTGGAVVGAEEDEFSMVGGIRLTEWQAGGNGDPEPTTEPSAEETTPLSDGGTSAPPITASATTASGPTFNACSTLPRFRWCANFTTSLRNGWLVQKVENTWNPSNCDGSAYTGPSPTTPRYWEAWQVDGSGNVTPVDSVCSANDRWQRFFCSSSSTSVAACGGKDSSGTWSMAGTLYAVNTLPAGFSAGGVPDAGVLQSTTSDPGTALGTALGTRSIGGTWNCCPPNSTHTQT